MSASAVGGAASRPTKKACRSAQYRRSPTAPSDDRPPACPGTKLLTNAHPNLARATAAPPDLPTTPTIPPAPASIDLASRASSSSSPILLNGVVPHGRSVPCHGPPGGQQQQPPDGSRRNIPRYVVSLSLSLLKTYTVPPSRAYIMGLFVC